MKRLPPFVALSLATALTASAQELQPIPNWAAPPYWAPHGRPEAGAAGSNAATPRETLAPQALPSSPLPFVAITPCRLADTRGLGFTDAWGPPALPASTPRDFPITGRCGIAAGAQAVSFNVTVTNTRGPGLILAYPAGGAQPTVSTVNYIAGQTVANAAIVPLGTGGAATFLAGVSGTDLILDVNGYYAPQASVTALNTLTGDVTLSPGANVSITPSGNTLTIAAATGGAPTGAAGGSLSGTYPNPIIASGAVGTPQLANNTAVRSINGAAQDLVTIQGSEGVSVATAGSTITIGTPSGSMTLGAPGDTTLIGAGYTEIGPAAVQYWTATTLTTAPSGRYGHKAVWTGSRMIVWGGRGRYNLLNDGGRYDPITNVWTAMTTTGAPSARDLFTAVWTGTRMVIWGGSDAAASLLNDGAQYDPVANAWTAAALAGAPSARTGHTAVWTGSRMIIWGGDSGPATGLNDGAQYDPVANVWSAMTTTGAPSARFNHTAVWTGTKMVIWGGRGNAGYLSGGRAYDPGTDSWTSFINTPIGEPSARAGHTAVWTGSRLVIWGGSNGMDLNDGAFYDTVRRSWTATSAGAPSARSHHTSVWTGSRMIVWGGGNNLNDGAQYDPVANTWSATTATGAPSGRSDHTAVWTGSRMIIWGGYFDGSSFSDFLNDGGQWGTASLYVKN